MPQGTLSIHSLDQYKRYKKLGISANGASTKLFYIAYPGNRIPLYIDGSFEEVEFTEVKADVPQRENSIIDVFLYWKNNHIEIGFKTWIPMKRKPFRIHKLEERDGLFVLKKNPTWLLIGTIRTTMKGMTLNDSNNKYFQNQYHYSKSVSNSFYAFARLFTNFYHKTFGEKLRDKSEQL